MTESKLISATLLVAIVGLVIVGFARQDSGSPWEQQRQLSVSGTHELDVAPDKATVAFQVMTRGKEAKDVSAENKALLQQVMAALEAQGVAKGDIETTGVTLQRWTEWDGKEMTSIDKGYEQFTTLKVTTTDLDKVGAILDAAIGAGANSVQDVTFGLKSETEERYKQQALQAAAKAAKEKAQLLASASGAELGDLTSVSENSYVQPYYYNTRSEMAFDAAVAVPTPISPQKVTIQASVNLGYELED